MKYATLLLSATLVFVWSFLAQPGVAMAAKRQAAEQHRIDLLLEAIGKQEDMIFIRNGTEHTAKEAVSHLERKLRSAGNRVSTAEELIDHLATGSSISGKPYQIRKAGKEAEPAGAFLHRLLLEIAPAP